jgi:hypothetical protein
MTNYDQDIICLSTDISLLYKTEKIRLAKEELIANYNILSANKPEKEEDRILLEKDIANDSKDTYVLNISIYDINCVVCSLKDIMSSRFIIFPKRKLSNSFNFSYENKYFLQYYHPDTFIQSFKSTMSLKKITMKISYKDVVLLLKASEYNYSLFNQEYQTRMDNLMNIKTKSKQLQKPSSSSSSSSINPIHKQSINTNGTNSTGNNEPILISTSKKDMIIDKGTGNYILESNGIQIVKSLLTLDTYR